VGVQLVMMGVADNSRG